MSDTKRPFAEIASSGTVENPPGIFRTTLSYNRESMVCHFRLNGGARIPLHNHEAAQTGYVVAGALKFEKKDGPGFTARAGSAYSFDPMEYHGAEALEDSVVIEFFTPSRPEYAVP